MNMPQIHIYGGLRFLQNGSYKYFYLFFNYRLKTHSVYFYFIEYCKNSSTKNHSLDIIVMELQIVSSVPYKNCCSTILIKTKMKTNELPIRNALQMLNRKHPEVYYKTTHKMLDHPNCTRNRVAILHTCFTFKHPIGL